jgi:hypothetical protein
MISYLTLAEFKMRTIMPGSDVDQIEAQAPGWILQQLASNSATIAARLAKRYNIPLAPPYPEAVMMWLARVSTVRAYLRRGVNPSDEQMSEIKADADAAWTEIAQAADANTGLWDLPLRGDTDSSGIIRGAPLGYSEQSPYTWTSKQSETASTEDGESNGTGDLP